MKVFSVYDEKAEAYLIPIFQLTTAVAVRAFAHAANSENHDFSRFAGDYTLFEIGVWDDKSGTIEFLAAHTNLGNALSYRSDE